ncbi:MAG: flagellar biosynthesis protein FlhA [Oscillospiraceae bacterium]|nr:flagellar biosynthesis protein FlhA [Oscillospiraceae bacterium]
MPALKFKTADIVIACVIVSVVLMLLVTLGTFLMDMLIVINIALAVTVLLIAVSTREALDFSTFPSLLLVLTIFRVALNLSSTRLILGNQGDAGNVIRTFGEVMGGNNIVIGAIVFLLLVIVQLLVITKGAERVSEVAARFTLDAMPGKQMAIDADLNSGAIDETEARRRRTNVAREADFYGSMDGATKFVKGDNILSIITLAINVIGGLIMGSMQGVPDPVNTYVLAAIGDGLSSIIPSVLISAATGLIVTKAATDDSMGQDVSRQITQQPVILMIAGGVLMLTTLIGMPFYATFSIGGTLIVLGILLAGARRRKETDDVTPQAEIEAEETRKPENVVSLLQVDPIELEFGYGIVPLVEPSQGGDLLDRVVMIRRQCAIELGMIVPVIRLRDNIHAAANQYAIRIKGNIVAEGEIMLDHYLAMNPGDIMQDIQGIETIEPAFGLPAKWISSAQRERAELLGYTIVDPPSVIATHLTEVVRRHAFELLGRQQVQVLVDNLRQSQPTLVDEVIPKQFGLGEIQRVLSGLLREGVSIRDMATILETLSDRSSMTRDPDMLTEYVRQALKRSITAKFVPDRKAHVITLDPDLEHLILDNIRQTDQGSYVNMDGDTVQRMFGSLRSAVERMNSVGLSPVVLTSPVVRFHFKRMVESLAPDLVVLSFNELEQNVDIHAEGVVSV